VRAAAGAGTARAAAGVGAVEGGGQHGGGQGGGLPGGSEPRAFFFNQTLEADTKQTIYTKAVHRPDEMNGLYIS
jgi:hypothetical protein